MTAPDLKPTFYFDRYINGVKMAEDVCVERASSLSAAMVVASKIASRGPNGEAPVLVYRHTPLAEALAVPEVAALVGALREIAAEASVPVHTWRNGINFKKMYEGWRKIAVERIDIARAAIAAAKGTTEIPASAENGRATVSRITKGDVS